MSPPDEPETSRTALLLMTVCHLKPQRANVVARALDAAADEFGIDGDANFGGWVAQMAHESGNFRHSDEIWGDTPAQQRYDTRVDLGNTPERDGDGYINRGVGWLQITGNTNLTECAIALNIPRDQISERLREDPLTAARGAAWWWTENKMKPWAEKRDIRAMSGIVNTGSPRKTANHLAKRIAIYNQVMRFLALNEPMKPLTPVGSRTMAGVSISAIGTGAITVINAMGDVAIDPNTTATAAAAVAQAQQAYHLWQDLHALGWLAAGAVMVGLSMVLYARISDRIQKRH